MRQKLRYVTPAVLREVPFQTEGELLAGSIVDKASITSVGQSVKDYDFSGNDFNHDWE